MTTSMWPSHEPILKAADDRLDHLLRLSPRFYEKSKLTELSGHQPKQLLRL